MKVILEAVAGPAIGRRIEISAGTILRIGRTEKSDYPLPEDGYLSGVHFAVGCDGQRCLLRDMGSSNGTFVNGSRIEETALSPQDQIMAGGSTFSIQFEQAAMEEVTPIGQTISTRVFQVPVATPGLPFLQSATSPPQTASRERWPGFSKPQSALLAALYRSDEPVYALVDAARDDRIPAFLSAAGDQYCSLSEGQPEIDIAQPAPFLVLLPTNSRLLDVLIKDGWGKGWAIYVTSHAHPEQVRSHLREYLTLRTESGRSLCFRFYDARILKTFVERCSPRECSEFFGPITRIVAEADLQPAIALEFKDTGRGAARHTIRLEESGAAPA